MAHVIEEATSGRSKCRGCGERIDKGVLRFGERMANPFGDGEATWWFHPLCAAFKRPEPLLEMLEASIDPTGELRNEAGLGITHPRLPRVDGAERATSGRAACRSCRDVIPKGAWRIRLVYYQEGRFEPGGFIHLTCAREHLGTSDILPRLRHFSNALTVEDEKELASMLAAI